MTTSFPIAETLCPVLANDWVNDQYKHLVVASEHGAAHARLRLGEVGPAETVQHRCLAADVLAECIDLVARHVQLVAALVGDQQVVALHAADGTLHHSLVLADAVVCVHHVPARLQVLEDGARRTRTGGAGTTCAATTTEVGLGDHRDRRLPETMIARRDC